MEESKPARRWLAIVLLLAALGLAATAVMAVVKQGHGDALSGPVIPSVVGCVVCVVLAALTARRRH